MRILIAFCLLCECAAAQSFVMSSGGNSFVVSSDTTIAVTPDAGKTTVLVEPTQRPERFKFSPKVEMPEPFVVQDVPVVPAVRPMSHAEMVAEHNRLHGGGQWTWPGDLRTHLETKHRVSTNTVQTSQPAVARVQSNCPNGVCPTNRSVQRVNRGGRGFLFWRR